MCRAKNSLGAGTTFSEVLTSAARLTCQLSVITQVLHSWCTCHCFDGVPTCPLCLCAGCLQRTQAHCQLLAFSCCYFHVVADCGPVQLIVVPIRPGHSWKKKKKSKVPVGAETSAAQLKHGWAQIFWSLVWFITTELRGVFVAHSVGNRWQEMQCNPLFTVFTPVSCFNEPWLEQP